MAAATSASPTLSPPVTRRRLMAKVNSPGVGASSASQNERAAGSLATRAPAASERAVSSKASGSTV